MERELIGKTAGILAAVMVAATMVLALPAAAQESDGLLLANLKANGKLHAPQEVLADFVAGKGETAVIVLLQPSEAARTLAIRSNLSLHVPAEFARPGSPPFYNLQDESIRTQLRATVTEHVAKAVDRIGRAGVTVTQRFSYQFGLAARVTPAALARIVALPEVVAVEKDHVLQPHLAQGIPLMNAAAARSTYTGAGMSIAICDTGIDTSHPRLGGGGFPNAKVIGGYDTGDNDPDPRPDSTNGNPHGTECAGIAAGSMGTVGDYIGGVAPDAKLYAIKISTGTGGSSATSAMIAGWEWALTHKNDDPANPITIISTSFGGGKHTAACDGESTAMTTAAANAVAAGITLFVSSGNDGYCDAMGWPACISYVNSVGAVYDGALGTVGFCVSADSCAPKEAHATCSTGFISWDSTASDKVTAYSNSASFLTLFAPSHNAYTTDIVGPGGSSTGDYSDSFGGTSAACPYAAGSAALLQQAAKARTGSWLTPAQVRSYLVTNGDNVTDGKVAVTKPRINVGRAIAALPAVTSAPVLAAEPAVTPGTSNTISWSAVPDRAEKPASAGLSVAVTKTAGPEAKVTGPAQPAHAVFSGGKVTVLPLDEGKVPTTPVPLAPTTIFSETFEGDFPGANWTVSGTPTWDDTSYATHLGLWSGWCADTSGVSPANGYFDNMDAWMKYGPFSLADATTASVNFWYKNKSELDYDFFKWFASIDGTNWHGFQVSGDQNTWRSEAFDLTAVPTLGNLAGKPQVWIAFVFTSDAFTTDTGAFVDDIVISKETAPAQPNLTPYQPTGWSDRIVVSRTTGNTADSGSLTTADTLYVDWAAINNGGTATAAQFSTELYLDNVLKNTWTTNPPLNAGSYASVQDYPLGSLSAGSHTLRIRTDSGGAIAESNEADNEYTKTINVAAAAVTEYYAESDDNTNFASPVASGWISQTQWTFTNLTPGATYWYRVKARRNGTESPWSNVIHSQQQALATTLQFSSSGYTVTENGGTVTITATRMGDFTAGVGVSYVTADGTATAGSDYTAKSGTLSWGSGDGADKTFAVPLTNDALTEPNETFLVNLSAPTGGAVLGSPVSATVTVVDTAGCAQPPIRISTRALNFYAPQLAFDAAESGDSLLLQSINFVGDILHWKNVPVTATGGYDCGCVTRSGSLSTITGRMTVVAGEMTLDGIVLK